MKAAGTPGRRCRIDAVRNGTHVDAERYPCGESRLSRSRLVRRGRSWYDLLMKREPVSPLLFALKRRGFSVLRSGPSRSLPPFLPKDAAHREAYYRALHHYSFRLFLRDVLRRKPVFRIEDVSRYLEPQAASRYAAFLVKFGLLLPLDEGFSVVHDSQPSGFGSTLEWYTAELLRRELGAETLYAVRFGKSGTTGDFDVLAGFDGVLMYVETKSSPPGRIERPAIRGFLDRVEELRPELAVFLNDTRLRMSDKIVPYLEQELAVRGAGERRFSRIEGERFMLGHRLFVMNAYPSLLSSLRESIRLYFRGRGSLFE